MIRVLQCVNNMHRAGLETMLMNYYRNMDRTKIQFDFLMHRSEPSDYDAEIESLGGRIYRAPRLYPHNYPAYFAFMKKFFAQHPEYRIVHSHIDAMSYLPLLAAKRAGVPVRIAHSHSASLDLDLKYPLKQWFRFRLGGVATHCFACGEAAGKFLFRGSAFQIVANGVEAAQFRYKEALRQEMRRELALEGKFVLGHVGRFTGVKNHAFLLEILERLLQTKPNAVLLLAGTGELQQSIQKKAAAMGISHGVRFLGNRADMDRLYQAMDVFVLPSLYEGVPLVGLEAQFAGLPCVFSDRVSPEVRFAENCCFLPLEQGPAYWAARILETEGTPRSFPECETYDIRHAHQRLEGQYMAWMSAMEQDLAV